MQVLDGAPGAQPLQRPRDYPGAPLAVGTGGMATLYTTRQSRL